MLIYSRTLVCKDICKTATCENTMTLAEFVTYAAGLKTVKRAGWVEKLAIGDGESVADHSYSASIIGMVLADIMGLKTDRVTRMLLLHDLAESKIGDIIPGSISDDEKMHLETDAFLDIVAQLPSHIRDSYISTWDEFCAGVTPEARLAGQVDKIEMALQAVIYTRSGRAKDSDVAVFLDAAKAAVFENVPQKLLADITSRTQKQAR